MENQEVKMLDEVVTEATEEVAMTGLKKFGVIVIATGGAAALAYGAYKGISWLSKNVFKPAHDKRKAKREEKRQAKTPDSWKDELRQAVTEDIED